MKARILICTVLFITLITAAETLPPKKSTAPVRTGVTDPVFNSTHAHRQGRGATIAWTTSATQAYVDCFTVIRTYEDPTDPYAEWQQVANMACNSSRSYRCNESAVSPGFVSYRIVASMVGGGYVFSDVETLHIVQH